MADTIFLPSFMESVSIRVDYFSLDTFYQDYYKSLESCNGLRFVMRPLNEEEKDLVNVDIISENLGLTITDILSRKCIIPSPIKKNDYSIRLIIGPYFLYCSATLDDDNKFFSIDSSIFEEFFNFVPFQGSVTPVLISSQVHSKVFLFSFEDGGKIFKEGAFPSESLKLETSRYADLYRLDDDTSVELIRRYWKGINQNTNETIHRYMIDALSSHAVEGIDVGDHISRLINAGLEYTSNCYMIS